MNHDGPWDRLAVALLTWLKAELFRLHTPGPITVTLLREEFMALVYGLTLPPPGAPDVASRELSVTVAGGTPTVHTLAPNEDPPEVSAEQGQEVALSLTDVDDAGNRSEVRTLAFTATDNLPPPQPGAIQAQLLREEP